MTKRDFQAREYAQEWLSTRIQTQASDLIEQIKSLELDRERLQTVRATLFVNFVERDSFGFQVSKEEFETVEAKSGLVGVLVTLLERVLNRSKRFEAKLREVSVNYGGEDYAEIVLQLCDSETLK